MSSSLPHARGLYDPRFEHDACGIGFVARLSGEPGHDILRYALGAVGSMAHRGGVAADGKSGDGAGVLTQIPRAFFARELARAAITYPVDDLAVGMLFLPPGNAEAARHLVEQGLAEAGLRVLGWRVVPTDPGALGERALAMCPQIEQVLIGRSATTRNLPAEGYERALYLARKAIEAAIRQASISGFAIPSLSSRTIVYKGLLVAPMLGQFYPDLRDELFTTAIALYHQRYSTNTFPTWELAQPFRMLSHNGEINTVNGNAIWMQAREAEWRRRGIEAGDTRPANDRRPMTNRDGGMQDGRPTNDQRPTTNRDGGMQDGRPTNDQRPTTNRDGGTEDGGRRTEQLLPSTVFRPRSSVSRPHSLTGAAIAEGGRALATAAVAQGPVLDTSGSDSSRLDNVLELMVLAGRDIRHAMALLVPEAWERVQDMDAAWRAFYQYNACLMEPWDGPAALAFSDGTVAGLALDRNGLRPARFLVTDDGLVVCGSEVGVVPIDDSRIIRKGKVGPGQMIAIDLRTGQFAENGEIKTMLAAQQPYAEWLKRQTQVLSPAGAPHYSEGYEPESLSSRAAKSALLGELQRAFGYTAEELAVVLRPMLRDGQEPVGSMGDDTGLALFSPFNRPLYGYFKQRFAEVTNPPIDPLREELVMSLSFALGRRGHLLDDGPGHAHLLRLAGPILTNEHLQEIRSLTDPAFASATLSALFPASAGPAGLKAALDRLCDQASAAVAANQVLLIISDRGVDEHHAPIPALLALGAVHQHLIRTGLRTAVSLLVESGEPREVHHLACLIGMGAEAVNPYLALSSVRALAVEREEVKGSGRGQGAEAANGHRSGREVADEAEQHYIHALEKGLLKIMSKMGISTVDSYCGAQTFEAVGMADEVIARCFSGVPSRLGGAGFHQIALAVLRNHDEAFASRLPHVASRTALPHPGFYKFKKDGEYHSFSPQVVHALQKAAGGGDYAAYKAYAELVHKRPPTELRDLLQIVDCTLQPEHDQSIIDNLQSAISLDAVEPIEAILRRFSTAAMSHGSTSLEAHETLAIAMSRLGGLSNSGEGGEDPARYGNERNSTIKQVASGRFGVTPGYLASGVELQIKMAQGSKPGEGGQIPGVKVTEEIARNRHTMPGVTLISPPPHHDIYSIEDLAQLIYDLKQVNPVAAVSVKLVAEAGVGTVAAGVAKGGADVVHISGHSGGTGASPLSSIKNAGVNWELGLAETQQTLVLNHLRGRVRVRVDGGFKTGHDVVIAALLGADEYSFGTAALVAEGCIMARTCHSNNCPVGIATQRPELRAKFNGTPEQVVHFFMHLAQEVREILASMGVRSLGEIIGRSDLLKQVRRGVAEADLLNLAPLIERVDQPGDPIQNTDAQNGRVTLGELNAQLLHDALPLLAGAQGELFPATPLHYTITNHDRTFGATLSGEIARRFGDTGLPAGTITTHLRGSAGQSFGAFLAGGVRLVLEGESNDYVGKGMAGGEIVVHPTAAARYAWGQSTIIGNTCLYGATGGALYAAGQAGERFAVRNSGAVAVVEGIGDHGCEYMTGGVVLVLGPTGRNFAAGMTGGVAYVYDQFGSFPLRCNGDMVELGTLDAQDEDNIRGLLVRHHERTGSPQAAELLEHWDRERPQFWRVRPKGVSSIQLPLLMEQVRVSAVGAPPQR